MWLCRVLVAAPRVFDVHCSRWILVPWPGINPRPLHWEQEVLATGQPTKEVPPQIFISEIKRLSFSDSIYRGTLPWTCDQRSCGLRLWRGCGKMDREEPGQLAVRVHPPGPLSCPCPSWRPVPGRDEQGKLELGVRWETMVVAEERVREAAARWEQGGKWSGKCEHPPGFLGKWSVQDKCFPPRC